MKGEAAGGRPAKRALIFFTAFAVVALLVGLGVIGLVSVVPSCDYAEQTAIPGLQAGFGFEAGRVPVAGNTGRARAYGITRVTEGGAFWRAGVRPGDRPLGGACDLQRALNDASKGKTGEFTVVHGGARLGDINARVVIRIAPQAAASPSIAPDKR